MREIVLLMYRSEEDDWKTGYPGGGCNYQMYLKMQLGGMHAGVSV